jgi:3-hydroxyisobutyrate dehydrogenase-like beta-hydroxyacid dehydrogenase
VVVSVCPPAHALDVARSVAALGFAGLYLDANAIAPSTMREVADVTESAGARAVDGGIIGPPARRPGTTRLMLSGARADDVAALFAGTLLEPVVVGTERGAASAVKVAYAAWSKGAGALLLAVAAYAEAEGVTDALRAEWARSRPSALDQLDREAVGTAPKGWRFAGEMVDSARAFADVGLPDGFGHAAADLYGRLAALRDRTDLTLDAVLAELAPG